VFVSCLAYHTFEFHAYYFFFQAEDGIRDLMVTGVQTCALPISLRQRRTRQANAGSPPMPSPVSSAVLEQRADQPASPPARELDQIGRAPCRARVIMPVVVSKMLNNQSRLLVFIVVLNLVF